MTIISVESISRNPVIAGDGLLLPTAIAFAAPYGTAGPLIAGTSKTTNTISVAVKSFEIEEYSRSFYIGTRLRTTAIGPADTWLEGVVTAWDGLNVTIDVDLTSGTGSYSDWNINVAGEPGQKGATGATGPIGPSGGPVGPTGPAGPPGSVWRNGNGAPGNFLGVDGDYYLDDVTGNVYVRATGNYSIISNIEGPAGPIGATGPAGGGAPTGAEYITSTPDPTLPAERVLTDTATITWDRTVPGQIKASTAAGGGNVSNSGTPAAGQYAKWLTATSIEGVTPATVLGDIGAAPVGAEYIASTANATLTAERVLTDTASITWDRTTAGQIRANAAGGQPQGRLTLQSATPVMTTTQAAKTTIYYTPYVGDQIGIYNGTSWTMTTFPELSVLTTDTTKNPAAIGASKVNDWYVWNDSGTLRLTHGVDWTNDTTRAVALVRVNGIWMNSANITNGPAAQRGTYVGTTRSNASSQLDWIFGGLATNGTAGFFGVWNAYNRHRVRTGVYDLTGTWTLAATSTRQANNSPTMRVTFVNGLAEDFFSASYRCVFANPASGQAVVGIGYDSITAIVGSCVSSFVSGQNGISLGEYERLDLGAHYFQAMESTVIGGTATFYGNLAPQQSIQNALHFEGWF